MAAYYTFKSTAYQNTFYVSSYKKRPLNEVVFFYDLQIILFAKD